MKRLALLLLLCAPLWGTLHRDVWHGAKVFYILGAIPSGIIQVYVNGVLWEEGVDYTITTSSVPFGGRLTLLLPKRADWIMFDNPTVQAIYEVAE